MKRFPVPHVLVVALAIFVLGTAGTADAVTYDSSLTLSTFLSGNSLTPDHFAVDTNGSVEVGLKAHQRFFGDVTPVGNVYSVPTGFSPVSGSNPAPSTNAWWNFNGSINLGTNPGNYDVLFKWDIDPGTGISWQGGKQQGTASLTQFSENYRFAWVGFPLFDPNQNADYNFILQVYDRSSAGLVASTDMLVRVGTGAPVPIPGAVWLLGSGLLGLVGIGRKRLKK
jgi:hypothetical protein